MAKSIFYILLDKFKKFWKRWSQSIISLIIGAFISWRITSCYSKKDFQKWQKKVALTTSSNIRLEQSICDSILRTVNDKTVRIGNIHSDNKDIILEYFDNIKNQIVILRKVIKNTKSQWDIIFPDFVREHKKDIMYVENYDKEILQIVEEINDLRSKLKKAKSTGKEEEIDEILEKLREKQGLYKKKLQQYKELPLTYPSSVVSSDTAVTGEMVLPDGSVFNPYEEQIYENSVIPLMKYENER